MGNLTGWTSHWHGDFANQSVSPPIKAYLAFELTSDHAFHDALPETRTGGMLDRGAVLFCPAQYELTVW